MLLATGFAPVSESINYQPKVLTNELQKAGVADISDITEIKLPDSVLKSNRINGKYFLIEGHEESHFKYIYIGRVNGCRAGGCSLSGNPGMDVESEYFDYYLLFDKNKTVQSIRVFNYQATHGQEITARGWLRQFIGHKENEPLQVDKNIDAISGATISVYAITADVEHKTSMLRYVN